MRLRVPRTATSTPVEERPTLGASPRRTAVTRPVRDSLAAEREAEALADEAVGPEPGQPGEIQSGPSGPEALSQAPLSQPTRTFLESSRGQGEPLPPAQRELFESRLGHRFDRVRIHAGRESAVAARGLSARAFTFGHDIHFGRGAWSPGSREGLRLLGHELVHTAQQQATGAAALQRKTLADLDRVPPWTGKVDTPGGAILRKFPQKDASNPNFGFIQGLVNGTEVKVVGRAGGWFQVEVGKGEGAVTGFVAHELVAFVAPPAPQEAPTPAPAPPSVREAFLQLKRAETRKADDPSFQPSPEEKARLDLAIKVLEDTKKYTVSRSSFQVDFVTQQGKKTEVATIEDFILFVEAVERQHPSAAAREVASEIRQLWFSDVNWELLVASEGIRVGDKDIDIETEPDPIAQRFDMKKLAPAKGSFQVSTRMGLVDIGHVMSGIDARLNGFPSAYPQAHLKRRNHDDSDAKLKYETLKKATGGDSRDFTTWAGDLGQAYAEYLVDKHVKGNTSASLATFAKDKAPPEEILGDIHGYIAVEVWQNVPISPGGGKLKVSNILRDLYLVDKTSPQTQQRYFELVSKEAPADQKAFIAERSLAFARPWYAKKAVEHRGWWNSEGFTKSGILENAMTEFDSKHAENESSAGASDKLETLVNDLLTQLGKTLP